jgi:hypothetical protein
LTTTTGRGVEATRCSSTPGDDEVEDLTGVVVPFTRRFLEGGPDVWKKREEKKEMSTTLGESYICGPHEKGKKNIRSCTVKASHFGPHENCDIFSCKIRSFFR